MICPASTLASQRRRRASKTPAVSRRGFTIVELLIVVVVLGLLTSVTVPRFQTPARDSREAALLFHLTEVRTAVERYRAQHEPRWPGVFATQLTIATDARGVPGPGCGPYLPHGFPRNPINGSARVKEVTELPAAPDDTTGWLLEIPSGEVRANVAGIAPSGKAYFDL
jgi:prepilin-type N-terminal cleavage/methylation domain-containing protein